MRKLLFLLAISTCLNCVCYAQNSFEPGYFVNDKGERIDCLIENLGWKFNPTKFSYKLSESSEIQQAGLSDVKEFGVTTLSRYVRAKVNIDRSSSAFNDLTTTRDPEFKEEELFLKVLIEGKASLYTYVDGSLTRFFYKTSESEIKQLVYKEYLTKDGSVAQNSMFRQQLFNDLKCQDLTMKDLEETKYTKASLERVIVDYNVCTKSAYVDVDHASKKKRDAFNFTIRPGINMSSLWIEGPGSAGILKFDKELGFRLGFEAEFILPFNNNNRWSVIVEPNFQGYSGTASKDVDYIPGGKLLGKAEYSSIDLPIGLRHYFPLNDNSRIFVNASMMLSFSSSLTIDLQRTDGTWIDYMEDTSGDNGMVFGAGYKYKRYSVELRYVTNREILGEYLQWDSEYGTTSMVVGFSF